MGNNEVSGIRSENEGGNLQNPEEQAGMPIPAKENEEEFCLSEDILNIIGKRVCEDRTLSSAIQSEVALRWQDILNQGLPNEDKLQLIKKYPPPENCKLCDPPKLNPEMKSIIQEPVFNRDTRILLKQSKLTSGLAAMGKAMTLVLKQGQSEENLKILECLGDAGSLLADLQHDESTIRRSLILANINPTLRSALKETQADEYLFSNKLDEVLKAAKALETASRDLRPKSYPNKMPKNSKLPPRQYRAGFAATSGGQKQYQREAPSQRRHSNYQRPRPRKEHHQQQQSRRRRH